jgi:WD40 repeat protein
VGSITTVFITLIVGLVIVARFAQQAHRGQTKEAIAKKQAIETKKRAAIVSAITSNKSVGQAIEDAKSLDDSFEKRYSLAQLDPSTKSWELPERSICSSLSTDGAYLCSIGKDKHLLSIIDVTSGKLYQEIPLSHWGKPKALAIGPRLPDGSYIGAVSVQLGDSRQSEGEIVIFSFEPSSGAINRITEIKDVVCDSFSLAFANTTPLILCFASVSGEIGIWEVGANKLSVREVASVQGAKSETLGVTISNNGKMLAISSSNSTVQLWSIDKLLKEDNIDALIAVLAGHRYKVMDTSFSPNGKLLASGGIDNTIRIWDIDAAIEEAKENENKFATNALRGTLLGHELGVHCVEFLGNNLLSSVSQDKTIRLWNVNQEADPCKRVTFATPPKSSSQYSLGTLPCVRMRDMHSDGRSIFTVSDTSTVQKWAPVDVSKIELLGHTTGVTSTVTLPGDQYVLTGGNDSDGSVIVWDISRAVAVNRLWDRDIVGIKELGLLKISGKDILVVGLARDIKDDAEKTGYSVIVLWDVSDVYNPKRLTEYLIDSPMGGVAHFDTTPKGNRILICSNNGDVYTLSVSEKSTGELTIKEESVLRQIHKPFPFPKWGKKTFGGIAFVDSDGKFGISAGIDGRICLIDITNQKSQTVSTESFKLTSIDVSPDRKEFAIGDEFGVVHRWNINFKNDTPIISHLESFTNGHSESVESIAYHPIGGCLVSGDKVGDIKLWNLENNTWAFSLNGQFGSVFDLSFSPNGNHLISTSGGFRGKENAGIIWDAVPIEKQKDLFNQRAISTHAKKLLGKMLYERPETLQELINQIEKYGMSDDITQDVIEEAKVQAKYAFTMPKNWRLLWWAREHILDLNATDKELKVALHWAETAYKSAPLRMDTIATYALAFARTHRFEESLSFSNDALSIEFDPGPKIQSYQTIPAVMAYIAKGIAYKNLGDSEESKKAFEEAKEYIDTSLHSLTEYSDLIALEQ